jgi:hypothetical protein
VDCELTRLSRWTQSQSLNAVQVTKRSKVWAPSAREVAVLEERVGFIAQQLTNQQQQWQGFLAAAKAHMPSAPPARDAHASATHAAGQGGSVDVPGPPTFGRPWNNAPESHLPTQASAAVRAKLQYLQAEVEKVIASAAAIQDRPLEHVGQMHQKQAG